MVVWPIKKKQEPGWLAVLLHPDRIDLAHVRRDGGMPRVTLCESFRKDGSEREALARLRKELHIERYRCTTLLNADEYQLHQVEAPAVPADELKTAVRWRVKDLIDYPIEAAAVDVLDIPVDAGGAGRTRSVYAVTAPGSAVTQRAQLFGDSAIPLEVIDLPELAQRNVGTLFEPENRGVGLLAFDNAGGLLTVTYRGELYAYRRIETPLSRLTDAPVEQRTQLLERIGLELQRTLDNVDRQYGFISLAKLLLASVPAEIGLAEYLAQNLYVPVEACDLAQVLDLSATPELREPLRQAQCLQVIGAALRDEQVAA